MPTPCDPVSAGLYAVKHNPAVYYTDLGSTCPVHDIALPEPPAVPDLQSRFILIVPNICNDMHDCSTAAGDAWLSREVPILLNSPEYRAATTVIFITWDENDSGGALVPAYVIAPSVPPGTRSAEAFGHYSLLHTIEDLLDLKPLLGQAASAPSMASAFHLSAGNDPPAVGPVGSLPPE
jgi:hypothetical protein